MVLLLTNSLFFILNCFQIVKIESYYIEDGKKKSLIIILNTGTHWRPVLHVQSCYFLHLLLAAMERRSSYHRC